MFSRNAIQKLKSLSKKSNFSKPFSVQNPTPNQPQEELLKKISTKQEKISQKFENLQDNISQTISDLNTPQQKQKEVEEFTTGEECHIDIENQLHSLKIYQNHSSGELMNLLMSNNILKYEFIVKNSEKFYHSSSKILGSKMTNFFVNNSIGRVFTGGDKLENMDSIKENLSHKNVGLIVNYCDEAYKVKITEEKMDRTTQKFIDTIAKAQELSSAIGVKYSAICDPDAMRKINEYKIESKKLFKTLTMQYNNAVINGEQLFEGLRKNGLDISESELKDFLSQILNKKDTSNLENVLISRVQWETLVHPYFIDNAKNQNSVIQKLYSFDQDMVPLIQNIVRRLDSIYEQGVQNPKSRIYVDAEQSYFQEFIESLTVQYQLEFNKEEPLIYSTLQCYLKDSRDKIQMELLKEKEFGVTLGLKLVKGAYINEEKHLPAASNLNDGFDATSECYIDVAKTAIDNMGEKNEVLIALHNLQNAQDIASYIKNKKKDVNRVQFAQLLGMADFLSFSLPQQGFKTSKYVPFGETEIMIPYLCRRAYEGFKFLNNVILAENLIKDELKSRVKK